MTIETNPQNETELEESTKLNQDNSTETSVEESVHNLSEEELDKYDTLEDYLATQSNQQVQEEVANAQSTESEQTTEQVEESGSENTVTNLTDEDFRKAVTSSFKANHKEFSIDDPDEIRKLMQYGLNYHKKMTELAPHRKALKTLEQHGLLNPDKLNYAIELLQGNSGAIAKLLKEHSIDTYELPDLEETPYQSGNYLPTDERLNFDEKVASIQETTNGSKVIEYVRSLDGDSFYDIYTNPDMMDMIQAHVESGLFEEASALLEKERALGKVPQGIKDIDAYAYVAQHLQTQNPNKYSITNKPRVLGNNLNQTAQSVNTQQNQAKKSASIPNNSMVQNTQQAQYSGIDTLLNASEEELAKYDNWEQYLASNNLNFQR